jgi:hypothetical protein
MVVYVCAIFGLQAARAKITRRRRSPTERSMPASTERDREKRGEEGKKKKKSNIQRDRMPASIERDQEKRERKRREKKKKKEEEIRLGSTKNKNKKRNQ